MVLLNIYQIFFFSEAFPKKNVHYIDQHSKIIVQTSDRTLHRLSTEIFKIFLEEVVFAKVDILVDDDTFDVKNVVKKLSTREQNDTQT